MIDQFNFIERQFPGVKKSIWKTIYGFLAWRFPTREWSFMNYGYDNPSQELHLLPEDEKNRYFIHMYAQALGGLELAERDILEVGCGRGGGSEWIARTSLVRSMTGLDLSDQAISLCREMHKGPNLKYLQGDAERLPFPEASFDIVINIESCHHYPSVPTFLREVTRVLKPGGYFCIADYGEEFELDRLKQDLHEANLELMQWSDISDRVVRALKLTEPLKVKMLNSQVPWFMLAPVKTFVGAKGTEIYDRFVNGRLLYVSARLKKTV